jgi:hypothetical protein
LNRPNQAQEIVHIAHDERGDIIPQAERDPKTRSQRSTNEMAPKLQRLEDDIQQSVNEATSEVEAQTARWTEAFQRRLASRLDEVFDLLTSEVFRVEI